jgi:hypothetical protein
MCGCSVEHDNVYYSISGNKFRPFRPLSGHRYIKFERHVTCCVHRFQVIRDPIYTNVKICPLAD